MIQGPFCKTDYIHQFRFFVLLFHDLIAGKGMFAVLGILLVAIPLVQASSWESVERSQRVAELIPGALIAHPSQEDLYRTWTEGVVAKWAQNLGSSYDPVQDYQRFREQAPRDEDIASSFPRHISPWARLVEGKATREEQNSMMRSRCPLTGAPMHIHWSAANPSQLRLSTGHILYADSEQYPEDSPFKPDRVMRFPHLDKYVEIPAVQVRDPKGRVWEVYPTTVVDHQRWQYVERQVRGWYDLYLETGNPFYVHKTALMLDMVAEVYWGLPPVYMNEVASNPEGTPLTRRDWEELETPRFFEQSRIGIWNRAKPTMNRGWISIKGSSWNSELSWVEPFARMRHHPAFREYSKNKYGNPEALNEKVLTMLIGDLAHLFKAGVGHVGQSIIQNYQNADYLDYYLLAVLAEDKVLLDFAGPAQEVTLYNHHHHDGMSAEGAPNYMAHMRFFYDNSQSPDGWLSLDPEFSRRNPFLAVAAQARHDLRTLRNLPFEFGDQHVYAWPPSVRRPGLLEDAEQIDTNAGVGSRFWPGYGLGVVRAGDMKDRMESLLTFTRVTTHDKSDVLGRDLWVNGIPVIRRGGYASAGQARPYPGQDPRFELLRQYDYPYPIRGIRDTGPYWYRSFAASPLMQNSIVIEGTGGTYYSPGKGLSEAAWIWEGLSHEGGRPLFQVLEVENRDTFERHGIEVSDLRRTLLTLESPGGRACMLDITVVNGGEQHLLFNTVWGTAADHESFIANFANLAEWHDQVYPGYFAEAPALNQWWNGGRIPRAYYSEIRDVAAWESLDQWEISFETDYGVWAPREQDGRYVRPIGEEQGVVTTWIRGLFPQGGAYRLIRGAGPWIAMVNQTLPDGEPYTGNVAFDGALNFVVLEHASGEKESPAIFIQLLEGAAGRVDSEIAEYRLLSTSVQDEESVAVEIRWVNGEYDWIIYQNNPQPLIVENSLHTDARYAWIRSNQSGLVSGRLVGGTYLRLKEQEWEQESALFSGEIIDVIGDVSGVREESALIVRSHFPVENPQSLVGQWIAVDHSNPLRGKVREQYRIEVVGLLEDGDLKLTLEGHPPFVKGWHNVSKLYSEEKNVLRSNRPFKLGSNTIWRDGDWAWFPAKNKRYRIERVEGGTGAGGFLRLWMDPDTDLHADGIEEGDWLLIHAIEPGNHVSVIQALEIETSAYEE